MGELHLSFDSGALAFLERLPQKRAKQVLAKIERLRSDPNPPGSKQLHNMKDGGDPICRIRSGDYRILYVVRNPGIVILDIGDRKDVYR